MCSSFLIILGQQLFFQGLGEYQPNDPMTFGGIYQYAVYPWFMTLFVISVVLILVRKNRTGLEFIRWHFC